MDIREIKQAESLGREEVAGRVGQSAATALVLVVVVAVALTRGVAIVCRPRLARRRYRRYEAQSAISSAA